MNLQTFKDKLVKLIELKLFLLLSIGLAIKWLWILSIDGFSTFFCFVNVFKAPNLYCFLVWISIFNSVKKIVWISYLVSFLNQFKNGRTIFISDIFYCIIFEKAGTQEVRCRIWEWSLEWKAIHLMQLIIIYRFASETQQNWSVSETQQNWSVSETTDYWWWKVDSL